MSKPTSDAIRAITARAAQDREYRRRLLKDPHAAIREATGEAVPPSLRIKFIDKDPSVDVLIVLPDEATDDAELTEEEMSSVAGGTDWGCQDVSTQ
jgi:hypothetical protein